jgi:tetratricopeptide (TPR) repeat protein
MAITQQPLNPYIAGKAMGGERGFFGRQDILREVERTLTSPNHNALVLFGQRRIGKTSILLQLARRLPSPPFVPIYFDLMDKAQLPLNRVLYELAATAAPLVGISPAPEAEVEGGDDAFRHALLPAAYEALGEKRRLVFLFDEFDVLDVAAEEKLPSTVAARAFFPYLRKLMAEEPRLGFVFVVGRKTDELSDDFLATFKAARYRRVSVLKPEAAQELITLAQWEGSLNFTDGAIERILALTTGHPYFTQLLCQTLFDQAYDAEPEDVPTVDIADVETAAPDALEAGNQAFEWVWDGLPPAERIIFSAIATHSDEVAVLTEDEIMTILQDAGIRILIKELALAPRTLVEWEMLKEAEGGYRFFVELMRRWVAEQKRLGRVKDELDRVIPLADTLYQGGSAFYRRGEMESAIGQLQQALKVNPNHLKARLLLGTIYREQSQLEEAIAEFETVYRYDEIEGRYELVRTLLAHGEAQEREGDEEEALKAYDRVLEVSPREQVAHERRAAIWEHRDAALEADDFETAIAAYEPVTTRVTTSAVTTPATTPPVTPPAIAPPPMEDVTTRLRRHPVKRFDRRNLDQIQYLVIQHSVLPSDFPPEKIADYLVEKRQWPGIGYHFYITSDGKIYQTNHLEAVCYFAGSNVQHNPLGVCICFAGNFTDEVPTEAQLSSGGKLLAFLMEELRLPMESIRGQKEFVVTQSPGNQWDSGQKWKDMLLAKVREGQD